MLKILLLTVIILVLVIKVEHEFYLNHFAVGIPVSDLENGAVVEIRHHLLDDIALVNIDIIRTYDLPMSALLGKIEAKLIEKDIFIEADITIHIHAYAHTLVVVRYLNLLIQILVRKFDYIAILHVVFLVIP